MLLKASIVHRGGRIRERGAAHAIGFDNCVGKALSEGSIRFLRSEDALTLQAINGFRDAAQHYVLDISEEMLYTWLQAGVTLFDTLLSRVFDDRLNAHLPERVLPISTRPPRDLSAILADEVETVRKLLATDRRRHIEAKARLRALAIAESAVQGSSHQPSDRDLGALIRRIQDGTATDELLPGLSVLSLSVEGEGVPFHIRLTKKEGIPVRLVREGTAGARVVAVKRVDELGFYCLSHTQLAQRVGITRPRLTALIREVKIQEDPDYFKQVVIGRSSFPRYSEKAVANLRKRLESIDLDAVWERYKARARR